MSGVGKTVVVMVVSGIVAIIGFTFVHDPGDPVATCQGRVMQAGDICSVVGTKVDEQRTVEEQADAQRRTTRGRGLVAGILGSIIFLGAGGWLALSLSAAREAAKEAAQPHLGLRKKTAGENGWTFAIEDPSIGRILPAGERKGKVEESYTDVLRGDLDGLAFEIFDHRYRAVSVLDPKKGLQEETRTVVLLHHPGVLLDGVSVYSDSVSPHSAAPLVLTPPVQEALLRLGIHNFRLYPGVILQSVPLLRDHRTDKLLPTLHGLRDLLATLPPTAVDPGPATRM
jgi:hypothetical protein